MSTDAGSAARWASFYKLRGYQALPSDPRREEDGGKKRPLFRYAQWWESWAPDDLFALHPTTNLQVMTGRFWGLLVVDLDGPEAVAQWPRLAPRCPRTWITHSGGGGQHWWFTIPGDLPPTPKAVLWREDPSAPRVKGEPAVERLCDRSLVMAPPSIHPRTGRRYQFLAGHSPRELTRPAWCPRQVLGLKPVESPRPEFVPAAAPAVITPRTRYEPSVRTADVLGAVWDKVALAQSWGLRFASTRPNPAGWCSCHAVGREDRNPSAMFSPATGRYWEPDLGSIGMLDLAVRLGVYLDWRDAKLDLIDRFCGSMKVRELNSIQLKKNPPLTQGTT